MHEIEKDGRIFGPKIASNLNISLYSWIHLYLIRTTCQQFLERVKVDANLVHVIKKAYLGKKNE